MTDTLRRPPPAGLADLAGPIEAQAERWIGWLSEAIRRPSRTGHLDEVRACGTWLTEVLAQTGWQADLVEPGRGAPAVVAHQPGQPGRPRLLVYSHYDVISPEPLDAWTVPPFGAVRRDGRIYGRGAMDAKANIFAVVAAVAAHREVRGSAPCDITLLLDGEEEAGSDNLPDVLAVAGDRLAADAVISFDGAIDPSGRPKIGLGTSGMVFVELTVRGADRELHSANGRIFPNPAWRLVWALASIKGPDEVVGVGGFDEPVRAPSDADRALLAAMGWDGRSQLAEAGLDGFVLGLDGPAALERSLFAPGVTLAGFDSGYTGPGMKAVIPATATAKLEIRIVPDQEPDVVVRQLRDHLDRHGFGDVELTVLALVETARTDPSDPLADLIAGAATDVYGGAMVKPTEEYAGRQGAWLGRRLGIPGAQTGIGPPGARGHAADEFVTEEHYLAGITYVASILERYGRAADG
jgi:acetylornithine deacetylase/succinyl-diaminopimelate desuccinylase-like protein